MLTKSKTHLDKGALGVPRIGWLGRLGSKTPGDMNEYAFYDTSLDNCIDNAFQALALDEKRTPYQPAVWEKRGNTETVSAFIASRRKKRL